MSDNLRSLIREHHAFYEVLPYYVLLEKRHGSVPATTQRVQAGFDIDIYGMNTKKALMLRIRISHWRGLDQPAGLPEQHALTTVETWLHGQGVARR